MRANKDGLFVGALAFFLVTVLGLSVAVTPTCAGEAEEFFAKRSFKEGIAHAKLRDELLNGETFYTLREAQVMIERWRQHYNTFRPHSALQYRPPAPEAIQTSYSWLTPARGETDNYQTLTLRVVQ